MSRKFHHLIPGIILLAATILLASMASAQVSLQDQLAAQYKLVKMGADSNGAAVVEAGTILNIKKGGVLSVPYADSPVATHYQDGAVHSPNNVMMQARGGLLGQLGKQQTTSLFQTGTKVYPSKVVVNLPKDQVEIGIVACDSCNNTSPTTFNKADVIFQFAKGSLATASAGQVEDTIGGLLAIDDSGSGDQSANNNGQQGGGNGNGNNNNDQQAGGDQGAAQPQQQAPPAEPQQIEKGQTPDQVIAAIGQPDKKINLGAKQIYVYKDIKVTFLNGKVSDVQ
jgi:hypothetical protein